MNANEDHVQRILPKCVLLHGRWYVGRGRNNTRIALWDTEVELFSFPTLTSIKVDRGPCGWFTYIGLKTGAHFDDPGGCFQPFRLIDEGTVVEAHDEAEYAKTLRFGSI